MDAEKNNESIVSFAFVVAGALIAYIVYVLLEIFGGMFGAVARFRNIPYIQHVMPATVGVVVFFVLFFNKNVHAWADEAVTEVRKVVWPSQKDVFAMTMVVCVMCILSGVALGLFDFFASQLMKVFVG